MTPNGQNIHIPTFSIPSKICQNWDFWCENKPSGNPAFHLFFLIDRLVDRVS
jgi:hypothetical protein